MKCMNGCDAPVCPPSKVICRSCMDRITANLEEIGKRMEAAGDCDCADDFTCAEHGGSHVLRDHK